MIATNQSRIFPAAGGADALDVPPSLEPHNILCVVDFTAGSVAAPLGCAK